MTQTTSIKQRRRWLTPLQKFMHEERSAGIVLAVSVVAALIVANSPLADHYFSLLDYHVGLAVDGQQWLYHSLQHWINDGLMSMFFFVVGLELKREFIGGELADPRGALLPAAAAVAGMAVPALIYAALNAGGAGADGWGIPMATDIAFSLAVVYALGRRVPVAAKVFLTTLAIVDDLGAVVVIALFYTSQISLPSVALGLAVLGVMVAANRLGVKNVAFYAVLGIGGVWMAFLMSGIHATIAAVLAAFAIPADARLSEQSYIARAREHLRLFGQMEPNGVRTLAEGQVEVMARMVNDTRDAIPPLQRLERQMHPFVSFVVMPVFALANAGVAFGGADMLGVAASPVAWGVALGLLLGKPLGVVGAVALLTRLGIAPLPRQLTMRTVVGLGFLASIGFTMSMFIATLAFVDANVLMQAKVGIFAASATGAAVGYAVFASKKADGATRH